MGGASTVVSWKAVGLLAALLLLALFPLPLGAGRSLEPEPHRAPFAAASGILRGLDSPTITEAPLVSSGRRVARADVGQQWVAYEEQVPAPGVSQVKAVEIGGGEPRELSPVQAAIQKMPRVSGSQVVWLDGRDGNPPALYRFDGGDSSVKQVVARVSGSSYPAVYGNFVAYVDVTNKVHLRDLAGTQDVEMNTGSASYGQDYPSLADGLIAFAQKGSDGKYHVWVFSFSTDGGLLNPRPLLNTGALSQTSSASNQTKPQVSGNSGDWTVAWIDSRSTAPGVYGYRKGGPEFPIATGGAKKDNPTLNGDLVVWEEFNSNWQYTLQGYSLSHGRSFPIATGPGNHFEPRVFGDRVVWTDTRNGLDEIYMATIRWVQETAVLETDEAGKLMGGFGTVQDITVRKQAEQERERLQAELLAAERARALIAEQMTAEINHRMKNNLMLLVSVLQLQLAALPVGSPAAEAIQDTIARITSLSVVHEHLYRGKPAQIELCGLLRRVAEVGAEALSRHQVRLTVTGEPSYVSSKLGSTVAVLANELITNALKYGAPAEDGKLHLDVRLSHVGDDLALSIWNSGNPLPAGFDLAGQTGTGLQLVQGVVAGQLEGGFSLRAREGGTQAEVRFPPLALQATYAAAEATTSSLRGSEQG